MPSAPSLATRSVPPSTVVPPLWRLAPDSVNTPGPYLTIRPSAATPGTPASETVPEKSPAPVRSVLEPSTTVPSPYSAPTVSVSPGLRNTMPGRRTDSPVTGWISSKPWLRTVTVAVSAICSLCSKATLETPCTSRSPAMDVAPPVRARPSTVLPCTVVRPV